MRIDPAFKRALVSGVLRKKIEEAFMLLKRCTLCPRECGVDRTNGETGFCRTGERAVVYSYDAHFGEESPLVGSFGSGTIFFSFCNMLCNFCQNYEISHLGEGREVTSMELAGIMLDLQKMGCHNINLVTPSHVIPQILLAVEIAAGKGLAIPLVYNTGGYDAVHALEILDGVVDIYMPDMKFYSAESAAVAGLPDDYPVVAKAALLEMQRQVGDLETDSSGIATKGLIVRHLVMPDGLIDTRNVMGFLHNEVSENVHVNVMSQYRPCGKADQVKTLSRKLSTAEYREALRAAKEEGITKFL